MPHGKPAGTRCIHLTDDHLCAIYGHPDRPEVCDSLRASVEMCGEDAREAFRYLSRLERLTRVGAVDVLQREKVSQSAMRPEPNPR